MSGSIGARRGSCMFKNSLFRNSLFRNSLFRNSLFRNPLFRKSTSCILTILVLPSVLLAADLIVDIGPNDKIVVPRHNVDIKIDGALDEPIWQQLPAYDELVVIEPDTLAKPPFRTRVRLFHTDKGLYIGIDMDQPSGTLIARLSGRDNRRINRDLPVPPSPVSRHKPLF